ncbi:LysE/ArgO family amino acid transporter [Amphibacillus sediminis]|uniref:LysE/ArgO family amino acid transporter n=1 Tax=Amphibacillus sediminis TaxID=360185 RepID=UPI00082E8899|nr:LysE family transporter [Amphibacillus sediminis]
MGAFIHGLILAFGLILPFGLQNLFIFNQGISQKNFRSVLPAIITASVCDMLLIILAVSGLSLIVFELEKLRVVMLMVGFCFLIYMGWQIWNSQSPIGNDHADQSISARQQVLFALSVSLLNPQSILDIVGVIGPSSLSYLGVDKLLFTIACISVSWIWFFCLALLGRKLIKLKYAIKFLTYLNQISAVVIWTMALILAYNSYPFIIG